MQDKQDVPFIAPSTSAVKVMEAACDIVEHLTQHALQHLYRFFWTDPKLAVTFWPDIISDRNASFRFRRRRKYSNTGTTGGKCRVSPQLIARLKEGRRRRRREAVLAISIALLPRSQSRNRNRELSGAWNSATANSSNTIRLRGADLPARVN